jgi:hypothetical protein
MKTTCHASEGWHPGFFRVFWMPAFAGMTKYRAVLRAFAGMTKIFLFSY